MAAGRAFQTPPRTCCYALRALTGGPEGRRPRDGRKRRASHLAEHWPGHRCRDLPRVAHGRDVVLRPQRASPRVLSVWRGCKDRPVARQLRHPSAPHRHLAEDAREAFVLEHGPHEVDLEDLASDDHQAPEGGPPEEARLQGLVVGAVPPPPRGQERALALHVIHLRGRAADARRSALGRAGACSRRWGRPDLPAPQVLALTMISEIALWRSTSAATGLLSGAANGESLGLNVVRLRSNATG